MTTKSYREISTVGPLGMGHPLDTTRLSTDPADTLGMAFTIVDDMLRERGLDEYIAVLADGGDTSRAWPRTFTLSEADQARCVAYHVDYDETAVAVRRMFVDALDAAEAAGTPRAASGEDADKPWAHISPASTTLGHALAVRVAQAAMRRAQRAPVTATLPPAVGAALDALDEASRAYLVATRGNPDAHDEDAADAENDAIRAVHAAVRAALIAAKCRDETVLTAGEHLSEVCYDMGGGRAPEVVDAARNALALLLARYASQKG